MKNTQLTFDMQVDQELRLYLNKSKYAAKVFKLIDSGREYLNRWLPWVSTVNVKLDTINYLNNSFEKFNRGEGFAVVILYQGKTVGMIGLEDYDESNLCASIGYWLGRQYQGHGIMTRSCRAMLDYAFYELELNRIQIKSVLSNYRSRAIPIRLGFTLEGVFREKQRINKRFNDLAIYSMLRSEWPSINI